MMQNGLAALLGRSGFKVAAFGLMGAVCLLVATVVCEKYLPGDFEPFALFLVVSTFGSGYALVAYDHYLFRVGSKEGGAALLPLAALRQATTWGGLYIVTSVAAGALYIGRPRWVLPLLAIAILQASSQWRATVLRLLGRVSDAQFVTNAWRYSLAMAVGGAVIIGGGLDWLIAVSAALWLALQQFFGGAVSVLERGEPTGSSRQLHAGFAFGSVLLSILVVLDRLLISLTQAAPVFTAYTVVSTLLVYPITFASALAALVSADLHKQGRGQLASTAFLPAALLASVSYLVGYFALAYFRPELLAVFPKGSFVLLYGLALARLLLGFESGRYGASVRPDRIITVNLRLGMLMVLVCAGVYFLQTISAALVGVALLVLLRVQMIRVAAR
jgi:hypothetical protein